MTRDRLHSIDDYERFLAETLQGWTPERRTVFAAAMADRWLPVYAAFSERESWGDPASLRRSVDAAWAHVLGRTLGRGDQARHLGLVRESIPHMDDFDAPEALAAAVMVQEAVASCGGDNLGVALQAGLSGFEAIVPDWSLDPAAQPRLWQRGPVRKELEKQLALLERIGDITEFDERTIAALRRDLGRRDLGGELPKRKSPPAPAPRTNQDVFEQYRSIIELDNRSRKDWTMPGASPATIAMLWFMEWMGRYKRRLDLLTGVYGKLADTVGQTALVRRQQARDRAEPAAPGWDAEVREMVDRCLQNPMLGVDVRSVDAPHGFGPSVRRLWADANRQGRSDNDAWQHVIAWARHRPAVWDEEDRRKKRGLAHSAPALGPHLAREVAWSSTADPDHPWSANVDGTRWRVRLNDFPDEIMYGLVIADTAVGDFHDWPESWRRP